MRRASWMSLGKMVTRLAWRAHKLVSSKLCRHQRNELSVIRACMQSQITVHCRAIMVRGAGAENSQRNQIGLRSLLHGLKGTGLKAEIFKGRRHVLGYFSDEPLKLPSQNASHKF